MRKVIDIHEENHKPYDLFSFNFVNFFEGSWQTIKKQLKKYQS